MTSPESAGPPRKKSPSIPEELVYEAATLFQGQTEVVILHNGERYRLRQTKTGKLILNK